MSKPFLLYQAPVSTRSGYGDHARDLLKALKEINLYDIKIVSTRWGNTPMDQLDPKNEFHFWILSNIVTQIQTQPELFIQMTVPNEFQPVGKFNIGITAGIETNICPKDWIDGCNRMNLTIATSRHSKDVLIKTIFQERRREDNQVIAEYKVQKPVEVLFEGTDYKETKGLELLDKIEEDFCFLFVGHWLQGGLYHDRKDVGGLIQTFVASFGKSKGKKPALIIKTSSAGFSVIDREQLLKKIEDIKQTVNGQVSIYLLHGDVSEEEMWKLYNHPKVKASVSFTHGEGFGRPLLEFSLTGKPVIASNWSGHLDFLTEGAVLLDGNLKNVDDSAANQFLLKESQWFYVNYSNASLKMLDLYNNYDKYLVQSKKLGILNREKFSFSNMVNELKNILTKNVKLINHIPLKLPSLKKIELPKLKKID